MNKGKYYEKVQSKKLNFNQIPFLISPLLLRNKNLGQVDTAFYSINKKIIEIREVKSKASPGHNQMKRLIKTQGYLSEILELQVDMKIIFCQKTNDSLF